MIGGRYNVPLIPLQHIQMIGFCSGVGEVMRCDRLRGAVNFQANCTLNASRMLCICMSVLQRDAIGEIGVTAQTTAGNPKSASV